MDDDLGNLANDYGYNVTGAAGSDAAMDMREDEGLDSAVTLNDLNTIKALEQEHPDYRAKVHKWRKYMDLYASNDVYRFIFKHFRETEDKFSQRVERGYYYNYVKSVVELFTAFLFHHPIDRMLGKEAEEFEAFYRNADRNKTSWSAFMEKVCNWTQVEGQVGILIDLPANKDFLSEADRKEANHRPFVSLVHSPQIKDWECDDFGNFKWVKLCVQRPVDRDWRGSADNPPVRYQIWTTMTWEEWEVIKDPESGSGESARLVASGTHGLGQVPLVIAKLESDEHQWFGISAVKDIADINIGILNWSSLGDEEIYERCLNILTMEQGDDGKPIELSNANILEYPQGAKQPAYLEPGATPLEMIQSWINNGRDEIRRLAKINLSAGLGDVRQASSGIAKAFSFVETNQSLASKANNMEAVEVKVHEIFAAYLGSEWDGAITYPREFGVEDWLMLYQELSAARTNLTSETAMKELEKSFIRKLFARHPASIRDTIEREIDNNVAALGSDFGASFGMTNISGGQNSGDSAVSPHRAEPGNGDLSQDQGEGTAT